MIKLKTIKILPTEWQLDVIIGHKEKELEVISEKRYGLINDDLRADECTTIDTSIKSQLKGIQLIVICLHDIRNKSIIVHELLHAMWHISKCIGYQMNYDTQEWQAILFEYLFEQVCDKKGYKEYKL